MFTHWYRALISISYLEIWKWILWTYQSNQKIKLRAQCHFKHKTAVKAETSGANLQFPSHESVQKRSPNMLGYLPGGKNASSKNPTLKPLKNMQMRKWVFFRKESSLKLLLCVLSQLQRSPFNPPWPVLFTVSLSDQQPRNALFQGCVGNVRSL